VSAAVLADRVVVDMEILLVRAVGVSTVGRRPSPCQRRLFPDPGWSLPTSRSPLPRPCGLGQGRSPQVGPSAAPSRLYPRAPHREVHLGINVGVDCWDYAPASDRVWFPGIDGVGTSAAVIEEVCRTSISLDRWGVRQAG
jgi:hypothetical protein